MKNTWLVLLLILILQFTLRAPFINLPLEPGEEGLYSYFAQRISAGAVLYRDMQDVKPPGVFYIYLMAFKTLGEKESSIRLFSIMFAMLTTIFMFLIGKQIGNKNMGLIAALLFAVFSSGVVIDGVWGTVEGFMVLPMVIAFYCFFRGCDVINDLKSEGKRALFSWAGFMEFFLAGLFSGLAIMIKQVALFNFIALLIIAIAMNIKNKKMAIRILSNIIAGFLLMVPFLLGYFFIKGGLPGLIEFTMFNSVGMVKPKIIWFIQKTAEIMIKGNSILWLLSIIGVACILKWHRSIRYIALLVWGIFSIIGVFILGFALPHYYLQIIPGLSLLSAVAITNLRRLNISIITGLFISLLVMGLICLIIMSNYGYYFIKDKDELSKLVYGDRDGVIAREIGKEIRKNTKPEDSVLTKRMYSILFYSRRGSVIKDYSMAGKLKMFIELFNKIVASPEFVYRCDEKNINKRTDEFNGALNNKTTKYYIYFSNVYVPRDLKQQLERNSYQLEKEMSYPSEGVFVFKRNPG